MGFEKGFRPVTELSTPRPFSLDPKPSKGSNVRGSQSKRTTTDKAPVTKSSRRFGQK